MKGRRGYPVHKGYSESKAAEFRQDCKAMGLDLECVSLLLLTA